MRLVLALRSSKFILQHQRDALLGSVLRLCALRSPGSLSASEGVAVEQGEDRAVVGQQASRYVDHPLTLLVGLCENMEDGVLERNRK